MARSWSSVDGPPQKRARLSSTNTEKELLAAVLSTNGYASSFNSNAFAFPDTHVAAATDFIFDITKYIPAGCLRIQRNELSTELWSSCSSWAAFAHPRHTFNPSGGVVLVNEVQEKLLNSQTLGHYHGLHNAGWIRMEFKVLNCDWGQVRIFILPDDIGRRFIDRHQPGLRQSMKSLLAHLDISAATWNAEWDESTTILHINSELDEGHVKDHATLFEVFNTLASPEPEPELIEDEMARNAMRQLLDSNIEGLSTTMYMYQRRSAAMMLQREVQPLRVLDPRLRLVKDANGSAWYCDLDAGLCLKEPRTYETALGGICAETMGLGKTLICLALILATRDMTSQIPVEFSVGTIPTRTRVGSLKDMCAAAIGRTGTPWKKHFATLKAEGYDYSQCTEAIREAPGFYLLPPPPARRQSRNPVIIPPRKIYLTAATLVIVPPNLVKQWMQQIKLHTSGLKVLVMDSLKKKLPPALEIAEHDLVLFSKQRFDQEARDGSDEQGRRETTTTRVCRCPYIGDTRVRDCTCFNVNQVYRSPLKDLHFKRLITDEGHTFGNSAHSSSTDGITVVDYLRLSARWIVSGTPTQGLYGAEVTIHSASNHNSPRAPQPDTILDEAETVTSSASTPSASNSSSSTESPKTILRNKVSEKQNIDNFNRQERKDLEKLGNIATTYLKARPWANTRDDRDTASWSQYVMQPRHGSKCHGNMACLRTTLEGMIIRHRPEDVERDVVLPPLHTRIVILEGSLLDKMSLNIFSMMITSNAVTSERKDADYLFHPKQRKALFELVSNLRQASFFWSGYAAAEVRTTIEIAQNFLEKKEVAVSEGDEKLLSEAIEAGNIVLSNNIWHAISKWHEMPMYVRTECEEEVRKAWSLDGESKDPTLIGASMLHSMQKYVSSHLWKDDPSEGLAQDGILTMQAAETAQEPAPVKRPKKKNEDKDPKLVKRVAAPPALAGGVKVGGSSTSKKRARTSSVADLSAAANEILLLDVESVSGNSMPERSITSRRNSIPKSVLKSAKGPEVAGTLDESSPLRNAAIISTASTKLTYLINQIVRLHTEEKIIVFYEADNVAYYIAQALECLNIKHLIYAKTLTTARRSQYVVTFNHSEVFRVLLMDVSQAAFGLDLSSASRVFFVNPVFSPQIEAQAVKRAHRIGQHKPVYVETLVLKGSIEEVILERREHMSKEEHNKCKNILDDETLYDWIRNVRFLSVFPDSLPGPEQMADLDTPYPIFGRTTVAAHDPDADLVADDAASPTKKHKQGPLVTKPADRYGTGTTEMTRADCITIPDSPLPDEDENKSLGHGRNGPQKSILEDSGATALDPASAPKMPKRTRFADDSD
ncbi:hypothetical protein BP5796_05895 [Coleophoma crateriformis]|uniref:Helicase C-terminal domain-containing protein n=1 Tax=Coleophoma crateriformis TaxID=565419 RepID=A0A3D8RVG2_9HELO|nr:hypothetical protein BP5796_05895 [Coleophoma crateriformis]